MANLIHAACDGHPIYFLACLLRFSSRMCVVCCAQVQISIDSPSHNAFIRVEWSESGGEENPIQSKVYLYLAMYHCTTLLKHAS